MPSFEDKDFSSDDAEELMEFIVTEELDLRNLLVLYFDDKETSSRLDALVFLVLFVVGDGWSRLVWLWLLRVWLVDVEELDVVELGGFEFLLERIRERTRVEAIGKSSMLWLLDVVTDLGFDEDGDGDDAMTLSEGFVKELFFWLSFGWSFGDDEAIGDDAGEEEDDEVNESPAEVSPIRPRSREFFEGESEASEVRSRGPVCPRPGPPRRKRLGEVAENSFWQDEFRDRGDDGTLFD